MKSRGRAGVSLGKTAKHCFSRSKRQFNSALSCDLYTKFRTVLPATSPDPCPNNISIATKVKTNFALGI